MSRTVVTLPLVVALSAALVVTSCRSTPSPELSEMIVHVVRHAEAWKNVAAPPPGVDPDALTPEGEAQARAVARWLAERHPDAIVTSDTGRTRATAQAIADAVGVQPRVSPAFASLRGGDLRWRIAEWAAGRDPRPEGQDGGPPGESMDDGAERARRGLDALAASGAKVAVVVTHADIVAALLGDTAQAGTTAARRWERFQVAPGSVSTLHQFRGVLSLFSMGHVPAR